MPVFVLLGAGTSGGNEKPGGRGVGKVWRCGSHLGASMRGDTDVVESHTDGRMNLHFEFHLLNTEKENVHRWKTALLHQFQLLNKKYF